jgi:hypothetical protein
MPTPRRSENRMQNHAEREVPVLPTSLTGWADGRICQTGIVLVVCAGPEKPSSWRTCEEDRVHTGPQRNRAGVIRPTRREKPTGDKCARTNELRSYQQA